MGHHNIKDVNTQSLPESFKDQMAKLMQMGVSPDRAVVDLRAAAWRQYNSGNNSNKWKQITPPKTKFQSPVNQAVT
jgi:hypothetical protein